MGIGGALLILGGLLRSPNPEPVSLSGGNIPLPDQAEATPALVVLLPGGQSLEFLSVPAGRARLGSPAGEPGRDKDEQLHDVELPPFLLGRTEVTQAQWEALMPWNPAEFRGRGSDLPVENVSRRDVADYLSRLAAFLPTGWQARLPTEDEWEYACRAGSTTAWPWGTVFDGSRAWYQGNAGGQPQPVGRRPANAWGFRDMNGNLWEWTRSEGNMVRGGSWMNEPRLLRPAARYPLPGDESLRHYAVGFRILLERTEAP